MTDVAHKLARQVLDRGEDSAGDDLALDLGEPVFYLIEPGGVSWGVVEMHFRVSREELLHPLGLVGRKVVGNEMDLLAARLIGDQLSEEGHKLLAGMARGSFAHHCAAFGVKRGVQREGAVAVVSRGVPVVPATVAGPDRADPGPGWRSSRRRKTPPHVGAA